MALGVLNNISAISAQNNLANTQASLSKTLQQLSSGSRINSGADDAAGLSLANGLQASSTALTQSAKNASEGVDFLQVADGALSQVTSLLNRAVTLATEAGNSTLNSSQTAAANSEYQKILGEINTINGTTEYNGIQTFAQNSAFSAANSADKIVIDPTAVATGYLNFDYTNSAGATVTAKIADSGNALAITAGAVGMTGNKLTDLATTLNSVAGSTVASVLNNQLILTSGTKLYQGGATGHAITENIVAASQTGLSSIGVGSVNDTFAALANTLQVKVGSAAAATVALTTPAGESLSQVVADINTAAGSNVASISGHSLLMTGATLNTTVTGPFQEIDTLPASALAAASASNKGAAVAIFTSDGTLSQSYNNAATDIVKTDTTQLSLDGTALSSAVQAQAALTAINNAITSVAASRGTIGANINTLTAVENVMTTQSTNTLAAENDVTATDYGQATSDMSKYQILSQTGIAALSQANQSQQLITKLLQ
jgi:flagellin